MARKVFFLLWMTIWPIAALLPAMGTSPIARQPQMPPPAIAPVTLAQGLSPAPAEITEELPDSRETNPPQLTLPTAEDNAGLESQSPKLLDSGSQSVSSATEGLIISSPAPVGLSPSVTAPRSIRKTSPTRTAQEEQAQKLIHERAQLRAQQRHARLEIKYHRSSGIVPVSPVARWHAQLTQPNWVAGSTRKP